MDTHSGGLLSKKVKVALGYPWDTGADRDCVTNFLANQHYFGRLQERLSWLAHEDPIDAEFALRNVLPPLDPTNPAGTSEIPPELIGTEFEFFIAEEVACSLPGLARENIVDKCLAAGMDYILWSDADMTWGTDVFLRLYLDQKPIVAALAFTGRKPIVPVIYRFDGYRVLVDAKGHTNVHFNAQPVLDYKRDALQQVDAIGSGVMLINCEAFKKIPKPWFSSYGVGEDIWFCSRAKAYDVGVWVDTRAKTAHKPTFNDTWHGEAAYDAQGPLQLKDEPEVVPA
jgi:hypothetical protein